MKQCLIDTSELARRTGSSTSYWSKLRRSGHGPAFVKVGRLTRYDWDTVSLWLAANSRNSTSGCRGSPRIGFTPASNIAG